MNFPSFYRFLFIITVYIDIYALLRVSKSPCRSICSSVRRTSFALASNSPESTTKMNIDDIKAKINSALSYHKAGDIPAAIQAYESLLFPASSSFDSLPTTSLSSAILTTLYGNLGAIRMQEGDYSKAAECFSLATQHSPENAQALYNLAVLYTSKLNEHRKALTYCIKALKLDASNHKIIHLMGNIFQALGRNEDAEKYFIQAESMASASAATTAAVIEADSSASVSYSPHPLLSLPMLSMKEGSTMSITIDETSYNISCLSSQPMLYQVDNLLSTSEISHIITRAAEISLEKSFIMGGSSLNLSSSETDQSPYRLSYNAWLPIDPILRKIQNRISQLIGIPYNYIQQKSEDLQVVRYEKAGEFKVHQDSSAFHPRLLTALFYLSAPENSTGGETWFPYARGSDLVTNELNPPADSDVTAAIAHAYTASSVERSGLAVKPSAGSAIIFFNYQAPDFRALDVYALHAGLPVQEGEKWIANYWIGNDPAALAQAVSG
jgi:prolyl 4-hydroxylase